MALTYSCEKQLKNCRFEAFLQRILSAAEFGKVEAYSPCVVQSSTEKLVFRHVVLTSDRIYLTEHPPRSIYGITNISDITDINMISEQPSFLDAKPKEICQHVKLTCRSRRLHKKSWKQRKSISEQNLHIAGDMPTPKDIAHHPAIAKSNSESASQDLDLTSGRSSRLSRIFNMQFLQRSPSNSSLSQSPPATSKAANSFFPQSVTPTEIWSRSSSRASNGRISASSMSSSPATSDSMLNNLIDNEEVKMEEINLYILNPNSKFVSNLLLIWDTKLITSTLTLEDDVISNQLPFQKNEKIEKLFKELSEELLENEKNREEEFFHLLQELFSSLKKYHILRMLFWKNPKLVQLLTSCLTHFLLGTNPKEEKLENREDELENKHINDIIEITLTIPKLPTQYLNTTKRMLNDYCEFSSNVWNNLPEAEDQFIPRSFTQLLTILTKEEYYKPNEVILLYKYLSFLKFLMSKSETLKCRIVNDYNEEFRYFVNPGLILTKIINYCPLKRTIQKLIEDVNYFIN
uniref:Uncharacterized protein n=1 Tax=Strigamia maritima TaxID=126957 RepID=T1IMU9_STRMM